MMATLLVPDGTYTANGVTVREYDLTQHNVNKISMPSKRTLPLIGITIHNTDDINEARQTTDPEQYVRATVNGNMGTVRVHYYVDDDEAWQMLPLDLQGWHAGQRGRYDQWGSEAGNAQTISIECIMDGKGGDKDKRAEDNCARLTAWLLRKYGLSLGQVYTHNYWCNVRNGKRARWMSSTSSTMAIRIARYTSGHIGMRSCTRSTGTGAAVRRMIRCIGCMCRSGRIGSRTATRRRWIRRSRIIRRRS